ncbi:hypothetical protein FAM18129_02840 [Lacticaseibacillus paracasei]|nr:hypothetical protein FAM18129_02840 [Lacticaseibacillus paracasei]
MPLSTGVDEVIFRNQFIYELVSFSILIPIPNSINKGFPVLVIIRGSFGLLDFTVHTFCEII